MRHTFSAIAVLTTLTLPLSGVAQPPAASQPSTVQLQTLRKALQARPAQVVESPAVAAKPPAPAASVPAALKAGVLYKVPIAREEERQIEQAVTQRLQTSAPGVRVVPLPGVVSQVAKDGREVQLKPFALPGQPLTYQPQRRMFEGSIRVGVADVFDQTEGKPLSAPVTFQVLEGDMAQPDSIALAATSPPHQTILVRAPSPGPSVTVHIASRFDPQGTAVTLPVRPTLLVRPERAEIQGYGLETTRVHIAAFGLANPQGRVVQLAAAPSAFFEPSKVTLTDQGTAEALLRSDGAGRVTVTASAAGLDPGSTTVDFAPPGRTLIAGLAGGLLGGFLRLVPALRRGLRMSRLILGLGAAVATGLLVFILYIVGVNVLPVEPKVTVGTAFVLAVAALGAWFGTGLLDNLKKAQGTR